MGTAIVILVGIATVAIVAHFARQEFRSDRIPIIIYHRIVADETIGRCHKSSYVISASNFAAQMQWLHDNGWTPIDLDDFLHYRQHPQDLPAKPLIISFDDGYENNYLYGLPILKKLGFKAVIYSVSDPASAFFNEFETPERLMSAQQMRAMTAAGITIQGHTATHPHLKELNDKQIETELRTCKSVLEQITDAPVLHMAIPFGSWDRRLRPIVQKCGYQTLAVPGKGTNNLKTPPLALRRLSIHRSTSLAEFEKILTSRWLAVINRIYAAMHLAIRYTIGQGVEKKIKKLFACIGLDNPVRLCALCILLLVAAALIALVLT